ncbi:MAG: cation-translocating P-type ATPase [Bacteroidales bacterium]|nr:cation-translocating P-type ATPase [Bacteroidales bacterium]
MNNSLKTGLSWTEASDRLGQYGRNVLNEKKKKSFFAMFVEQLRSFMILILTLAALISGIAGYKSGEGLLDTFIIVGIIILNAFIGAYQEKKAQKSLESLKKLSAPHAKVIRDGVICVIPASEIVPGDLISLETGDIVPADVRLTECANLHIEESSLTGESLPSEKECMEGEVPNVPIGDCRWMAFSSGIVTYGRGKGIVTATGMSTEVGKIAKMLENNTFDGTPMQRQLERLGKILGIASLVICAVIFVIGIIYGRPVMGMFLVAISLAVAAIPEGLPAIFTIILSIGVQRMVKRRAIIRTLPSVETLGSTTVICSDKTGTLTQNRMTVTDSFLFCSTSDILAQIAVLCNDSVLAIGNGGEPSYTGDPTETALAVYGEEHNIFKNSFDMSHPRVAEFPFDSQRKRMSVINHFKDGTFRVSVKGGLDEVLSVCKGLSGTDIDKIQSANDTMARGALRVLAFAYKDIDKPLKPIEEVESGLTFVGMVGMIDPAREEAVSAVQECRSAGIRPVMITGDHKMSALAIAKQIGIYREGDLSITGQELENMGDEEFASRIKNISVYARVAPGQKVRIVATWQKMGEIVAMTGDGVNDAPALQQADIGVAMGITGTEVAKDAADMILTDDNFATIVSAVEEGRRIYDNLLKTILFLLSTNIGVVLLLFVTSVFDLGIALLPIHILWINLVSESFPALALSVDPAEDNIMMRKPKKLKGGFLSDGISWTLLYQGVMIGAIPIIAFMIGVRQGGESLGQTMAFTSLIAAKLVHAGNLHSYKRSRFTFNPLHNKSLIFASLASAIFTLAVLLVPPLREAFRFSTMSSTQWLIVAGLALIPIPVVELVKLFLRRERL